MLLALVICFIGFALGQQPRPCFSPPQWEARLYSINEQSKMVVTGRLSYDSVYQRVRIVEDIKIGPDDNYYTILRLFQAKIEFSLNMKTKVCTRQPLERPWRDIGLFPDAQSHGEAYIGSSAISGGGLLVSLWSDISVSTRSISLSFD